jgi:hypothetical protein
MAYPDILTTAVYAITAVGAALGIYVTLKIFSKDGFR